MLESSRRASHVQYAAHRLCRRKGSPLEAKGSLHLFGGAEMLCRALEVGLLRGGREAHLSLAPSPLAALASARAGKPLLVLHGFRAQPGHDILALSSSTCAGRAELLERFAAGRRLQRGAGGAPAVRGFMRVVSLREFVRGWIGSPGATQMLRMISSALA